MLADGIILSAVGAALLVIAILLCLGHIGLLHDYHRNNVKEENARKLGWSMGLSLSLGAFGAIASGVIAIVKNDESIWLLLLLIYLIPFFLSVVLMLIFTKKYNGKIFG